MGSVDDESRRRLEPVPPLSTNREGQLTASVDAVVHNYALSAQRMGHAVSSKATEAFLGTEGRATHFRGLIAAKVPRPGPASSANRFYVKVNEDGSWSCNWAQVNLRRPSGEYWWSPKDVARCVRETLTEVSLACMQRTAVAPAAPRPTLPQDSGSSSRPTGESGTDQPSMLSAARQRVDQRQSGQQDYARLVAETQAQLQMEFTPVVAEFCEAAESAGVPYATADISDLFTRAELRQRVTQPYYESAIFGGGYGLREVVLAWDPGAVDANLHTDVRLSIEISRDRSWRSPNTGMKGSSQVPTGSPAVSQRVALLRRHLTDTLTDLLPLATLWATMNNQPLSPAGRDELARITAAREALDAAVDAGVRVWMSRDDVRGFGAGLLQRLIERAPSRGWFRGKDTAAIARTPQWEMHLGQHGLLHPLHAGMFTLARIRVSLDGSWQWVKQPSDPNLLLMTTQSPLPGFGIDEGDIPVRADDCPVPMETPSWARK